MATNHNGNWPERPAAWGDVLTDLQVCQFLGLDQGRTPASARRTLRFIRGRTGGPPDIGRLGGRCRFRREGVESWLRQLEGQNGGGDTRIRRPRRLAGASGPQGVTAGVVREGSDAASPAG